MSEITTNQQEKPTVSNLAQRNKAFIIDILDIALEIRSNIKGNIIEAQKLSAEQSCLTENLAEQQNFLRELKDLLIEIRNTLA